MSDFFFCLTVVDQTDKSARLIELTEEGRVMPGWNEYVKGWSLGSEQSEAFIKLDEPSLDHAATLGVLPASNHVILSGELRPGGEVPDIDGINAYSREDNSLYVRFDRRPLRIGRFVIQFFYSRESAEQSIQQQESQ